MVLRSVINFTWRTPNLREVGYAAPLSITGSKSRSRAKKVSVCRALKRFPPERICAFARFKRSLTFCGARPENSEPMKKYILSLLGIFVAMAFLASCQQEGTTVTEEPASGSAAYMNRPAPSPTR